jgi:integrase
MRRSVGSIDVRGGRHRARIRVGDKQVTIGTFDTVEEAESAIALVADAHRVEQPFAGMSLKAWGKGWLDKRKLDGVRRSVKKDRYLWRRIESSDMADVPLAAITPRDVRNWIAAQIRTPTKRAKPDGTVITGKPPARQTILNALNLLRVSLEDACNDHHIETNPARAVKVPRIARTSMPWTYLTAPEIELLTGPKVDQPNRDVFTFAIFSGLRAGEIFGLQWADVDLDARTANIRYSWKATPTKRGHVRSLNLLGPAVDALRRQKARTGGVEYVFARRDGEPYAGDYDADIRKWLDTVGIKRRVRFHDLRHTCASHLVSGTWGHAWSIEEVAAHLGRSSSTTSRRYAHLSPDGLKRAVRETRPELHVSRAVSKSVQARLLDTAAIAEEAYFSGGEGIRTPGGVAPTAVFKTAALDHSATPPSVRPHGCRLKRRGGQTRRAWLGRAVGASTMMDRCPLHRDRRGVHWSLRTGPGGLVAVGQGASQGSQEMTETVVKSTGTGLAALGPRDAVSWQHSARRNGWRRGRGGSARACRCTSWSASTGDSHAESRSRRFAVQPQRGTLRKS